MFYKSQQRTKMAFIFLFTILFVPQTLMAEEVTPEFARSISNYDLPNVTMIRQDGKKLAFNQALDDGRPVMLNLVFTSCSAICPMLSQTFSKVQTKLAKDKQKLHLVSVSIDPENDTPEKLREYAKKFNARPDWDFYTSTIEDSIEIQKAFNAYGGDKMNHASIIFMRVKPNQPWLRIEGFVSPDTVIREYHSLLEQK